MDVQTLIMVFVVMVVGFFVYSLYEIQGKIWCTFRRQNKTKVEKWVSMKSGYVHFDNEQYIINTKRITLLRWKRGIFQFFPIFVPSLDYSWHSTNPHNPEDFNASWDTPAVREAARQEESFIAFAKAQSKQLSTKSKLSDMLFPIITIGAILVIGYLVYQQGAGIAQNNAILHQLINPTLPGVLP